MEEVKEFVFCKKYEAHNRTFWFIYPLLNIPPYITKLGDECINKKNLYISDENCPYSGYNKNMIIYAFTLKEENEEFFEKLKNLINFVFYYKINEVNCFIFELHGSQSLIYEHFKNSQYSKMNILTTINDGSTKRMMYADVFKGFENSENKYAGKVYNVIKKTEKEKLKFQNWLKQIGSNLDAEQLELESQLKLEEETINYENKI
jgi:hypothetical protein